MPLIQSEIAFMSHVVMLLCYIIHVHLNMQKWSFDHKTSTVNSLKLKQSFCQHMRQIFQLYIVFTFMKY